MILKNSYFSGFEPIRFEGPSATSDFSYRYYNKDQIVMGKRMEDHLRFAVCFWHTVCWPGSDIFGSGTFNHPWLQSNTEAEKASARRNALLWFVNKLDLPFYCFHDVDIMAQADCANSFRSNLAEAVDHLAALQEKTGRRLLWGTANLFSHPRYMAGAATNPDPAIFSFAALQVKEALEATHRLGGANYVLWGGREGYDCLHNTNISKELDNFGRFLSLVVAHKHKIGFKGALLIEPKPHEPTKHQYDFDVQTVYGFLKRYGLENEIKVNIEANHATLSGHSFEHEIAMAGALGILGSIDANRGDPQNGWDTDQFPVSTEELSLAMIEILRAGGLGQGGFNFDAKVRRQSIDLSDIFYGHIGGIDTIARALLKAANIIEDGRIDAFKKARYQDWDGDLGKLIHDQATSLSQIAELAVTSNAPQAKSGRQEWCENIINQF